jgi:xanthosine utilization system XapX-like protein
MITIGFLSFVALAATVSLADWRRGWLLAIVVGVLQDPVRKLVPGSPVYLTFSIVGVYIAIVFSTQQRMQRAIRDFSRRFGTLWGTFGIVLLFLVLAALNGLMTYGLSLWKAPLLSLFIYVAPLPAIVLGYMYLDDEEKLFSFFRFYAVITSIALIGTPLEYYRVKVPALGMVMQVGDYIRFLPGMEVRMLSGFYRAPDIMGWHAATLTAISVAMIVRSEFRKKPWLWMFSAGWGFYCCMICGRRKAIYYVAAFAVAFVWRYFRRLRAPAFAAFAIAGLIMILVIHQLQADAESKIYAAAAMASSSELTGRLEGGVMETIRQFGILGAGLGTATQGVQHVLGPDRTLSWQEGGLGKLAIELGLPGLLAVALLFGTAIRVMIRISGIPDHPATSQIGRAALFGIVAANIVNFMASAQTYSDPVLTILACFFTGCLFATVTLDERAAAASPAESRLVPATA